MDVYTRFKKNLIKRYSFLAQIQRFLYRFKPYSAKFQSYYRNNGWNNKESLSGLGSTIQATQNIKKELPNVLKECQIKSIIDVPCGDFNWMKEINLTGINYRGFDIVPDLINDNQKKFSQPNIVFEQFDLIKDPLPQADLIITRDCLFHFSNKHIIRAIRNITQSKSAFLMTTTFDGLHNNSELYSDGLFRPINLQLPPYNFPVPLLKIPEESGLNLGKVLALWRIKDILIQGL